MGHHILVSLYGIHFSLLNDLKSIKEVMELSVLECGATVLNRFSHQFEPYGVTIVYALAESHISIHTFPEKGSCAIDVYTCGDMNPKSAMDVFVQYFKPVDISMKEFSR